MNPWPEGKLTPITWFTFIFNCKKKEKDFLEYKDHSKTYLMERMRWLIFALISYCSALLNDTNKHPYTL